MIAVGQDPSFGVVSKADREHFDGLAALVSSLRQHMRAVPIQVLDCGLTPVQRRDLEALGAHVTEVDVSSYEIRRAEDQGKFSSAIYAILEADFPEWAVTIALDADTLVLGDLTEIARAAMRSGLTAAPDHPPLDLRHQIGSEGALPDILSAMPELDLSRTAFNAGVLGFRNDYFRERILPAARKLKPLHQRLWANDQAILNLAAFAANPDQPYEALDRAYNARPRYRRAPGMAPPQETWSAAGPGLRQGDSAIHVMHFVGHPKPWMPGYPADCPALATWRAYRETAGDSPCVVS